MRAEAMLLEVVKPFAEAIIRASIKKAERKVRVENILLRDFCFERISYSNSQERATRIVSESS
jgi:hypothetical protein